MRLILTLLCLAAPAFSQGNGSPTEGESETPPPSSAGTPTPRQASGNSTPAGGTLKKDKGDAQGSLSSVGSGVGADLVTEGPYEAIPQPNRTPGSVRAGVDDAAQIAVRGAREAVRKFLKDKREAGSGYYEDRLRTAPTGPSTGQGGVVGTQVGQAVGALSRALAQPGSSASQPLLSPAEVRRMAAQEPRNPIAQGGAGSYFLGLRDYGQAAEYFQSAVDLGAEDPVILTAYAEAALNAGKPELARSLARQALEKEPGNKPADALLRLTDRRVETSGLSEKLKKFLPGAGQAPAAPKTRLAAAGPALPAASVAPEALKAPALVREARQALSLKDSKRAGELAGRALAEDPDNAAARVLRAFAHNREGRAEEALADAEAVLERKPGHSGARLMRAWAFNLLKRHAEALADARAVLSRREDQRMARYLEGVALAGLGRWDEARAALERAAVGRPGLERALSEALASADPDALLALLDGSLLAPTARASAPSGRPFWPPSPAAAGLWGGALGAGAGLLLAWGLRRKGAGPRVAVPPAAPPQYDLVREIGRGGMGVVYEAVDRALGRRVALKRMSSRLAGSPAERERFLEEARTVARLKHPNIVEIYSILDREGEIYLVFEHVPGRPVSGLLAECGRLAWSEARRILLAACAAVEYAHRNGVIHRDLKPSNVMVTDADEVKVMDFGVARQPPEGRSAWTRTVSGTPAYMAPEQEQGAARKESDLFALGVCLYEMLSGELPFEGQGAGMLLNKLRGNLVPLSRRLPGGFPAGLDPLLAQALAPDPLRRFRSAADLGRALEAL